MTEEISSGNSGNEPKRVFISDQYIGDIIDRLNSSASRMERVEIRSFRGYMISGYIFNSPPSRFAQSFQEVGIVSFLGDQEISDEIIPILGKTARIEVFFGKEFDGGYHSLQEWISKTLFDLVAETGVLFTLSLASADVVLPVVSGDSYYIHLNSSPPGERIPDLKRTSVCNVLFGEDANGPLFVCAPVRGYGNVIYDDEGEPLAQIMGKSIYLFLPTKNIQIYRRDQGQIFRVAMRHVWNAIHQKNFARASGTKIEESEDLFTAYDAVWSATLRGIERSRENTLAEIVQLERKIHDLHMHLRHIKEIMAFRALSALGEMSAEKETERAKDWERIASFPLIDSIECVDDGLQIKTKQVFMQFDGVMYHLGSYFIRIGEYVEPIIWSDDSRHPKGVMHPHIGKSLSPCYGNATIEISRAAAQGNIADLLELTLSWLSTGYDPSLTETPITEWPKHEGGSHHG